MTNDTRQTLDRSPHRVRGSRTWALAIILLAVANHGPSLGWGFLYDDFMQQFFIRFVGNDPPGNLWNLYDFASAASPNDALGERGLLPWWTSEDFKIRYFRPVTSLSILADAAVYGRWAPGYHATSLVLFGIFLFLTYEVYTAVGLSERAALWALGFLAFDDVHALPVGWLAARATLMAALFISATVLAIVRYERRKKPLDLAVAILVFLFACGSKEDSAIVVPILALYLLLLARPNDDESLTSGSLRVLRSKTLWVFGLVASGYVVFYAGAGYATNSALHLTPWREPGRFAIHLVSMIPLNLTTLFLGIPGGDLVFTRPHLRVFLVGLSFLTVSLLVVIGWRWAAPRSLAAFAIGWALLALTPASVVATSDRVLTIAAVGTAMALGLVMDNLGPVRTLVAGRRYRTLGWWALFVTAGLIVSIPMLHVRGFMFSNMAGRDRDAIVQAEIDDNESTRADVLVLNSPSSLLSLFMPLTASVVHDDPTLRVYPLQFGRRSMTWHRVSDRALVVTYGSPPLLDHRFELLFRTEDAPPAPGTTFEAGVFSVTVLDTDATGIRTVRFTSGRSFDDPSYRFLVWKEGRFRRVPPPAVGEEVVTISEPTPTVPWAP